MEVFVGISLSLSLLLLGISLGAIIENKRIKTAHSIETINLRLRETQEILLPLADKITHHDMRDQSIGGSTMVDYRWQDPDKTLEIPNMPPKAHLVIKCSKVCQTAGPLRWGVGLIN